MLFVVTVQTYSGTVCVSTNVFGIEAIDFEKAKEILIEETNRMKHKEDSEFKNCENENYFSIYNDKKVSDEYNVDMSLSNDKGESLNMGKATYGPIYFHQCFNMSKAELHIVKKES